MLASVQLSARKSSGQRSVFPNFRPDEQWGTLGCVGACTPTRRRDPARKRCGSRWLAGLKMFMVYCMTRASHGKSLLSSVLT